MNIILRFTILTIFQANRLINESNRTGLCEGVRTQEDVKKEFDKFIEQIQPLLKDSTKVNYSPLTRRASTLCPVDVFLDFGTSNNACSSNSVTL
jgi:hypothetical protein